MNKTEGRVRETEGCNRIRQRGRVRETEGCNRVRQRGELERQM